ncbi:MAG: IclR family transcriptional regulator [Alphaproteobacteria bacterium]|nr:IclR family transcriptional regulator [Alphaproteobacteria bacterium]
MRRALAILEKVASAERPLTPTELNKALELPKPTIHRLCVMLANEGYLQRSLDGKGLIAGPKLRAMAVGVMAGAGGQRAALHAILEELADNVGETCNINIPDGNAMRYLDRVEARWPLRLQLPIGTRVPLHCTASGKMFLGSLPPARRRQVVDNLTLEPRTPNTISDSAKLMTALDRVREAGYGTDNEEFLDGMVAVAVPVIDGKGRLLATLALHGPTQRLTLEKAKTHIPRMRLAAERLGKLFAEGSP